MPNTDALFRPRPSESPLTPMRVLETDYEVRLGEVVKIGGFPLMRTDDGWRVVEHVDLRGVVETDD